MVTDTGWCCISCGEADFRTRLALLCIDCRECTCGAVWVPGGLHVGSCPCYATANGGGGR